MVDVTMPLIAMQQNLSNNPSQLNVQAPFLLNARLKLFVSLSEFGNRLLIRLLLAPFEKRLRI